MPTFSLAGQLRFQPTWTDTLSTTDVVDSVEIIRALTFANGTGAGQANAYWRDVRTVAATTNDFVVLTALPVSVFGGTSTLNMASVKGIYVRNMSATVTLKYGIDDGDSRPEIPPGGFMMWFSPTAATSQPWFNTSAAVRIDNESATSAQYEIVIIGVKAT